MRKIVWAVRVAALLALVAASGCYTVLSHPAETDVVSGGGYSGSDYRSCADCHADASYYHPYYRYGRSHDRWGDYYGFPWWYYDHWWYQSDDGSNAPRVPVETDTRHIWGSGGGGGTKGWSFALPPTPPAQGQRTDGDNAPETDDGKKDEKETDERHLWDSKKKGF